VWVLASGTVLDTLPSMNDQRQKPGPDPDRLKLDGDWAERVGEALERSIPPEGVPDQHGKGSKPRKKKGPDESTEPEED
jgi:hypothetical protein